MPAIFGSLGLVLAVALVVLVGAACGKKKPPETPEPAVAEIVADAGPPEDVAPAPKPLFERLGGADGIKAVVDKLVEKITADALVAKSFKTTKGPKLEAFKKNLGDQLCEVTGGTCKYAGKDMKTAHKGMKITDAQFDALVADLKSAMTDLKVEDADQAELTAKLEPLREEIVDPKTKPTKK